MRRIVQLALIFAFLCGAGLVFSPTPAQAASVCRMTAMGAPVEQGGVIQMAIVAEPGLVGDINQRVYIRTNDGIIYRFTDSGQADLVNTEADSATYPAAYLYTLDPNAPGSDGINNNLPPLSSVSAYQSLQVYAVGSDGNECAGSGQINVSGVPPTNTPAMTCDNTANPDYNSTACQRSRCEKVNGKVFTPAFNNGCVTLMEFIQTLINYFLTFASIIAGFMFVKGSYGILVSRGNAAAVAEARDALTNAVIGLVLVAIAFVVIKFLNGAFQLVDPGINLIGPIVQTF